MFLSDCYVCTFASYYLSLVLYMCPHANVWVLILRVNMCPHTVYMCPHANVCVLILRMCLLCPHTTVCVLILHMSSVSACYCVGVLCVRVLLYVSSYCTCPLRRHTTAYVSYVSAYYCMCPHTARNGRMPLHDVCLSHLVC